MSLPSATSNRNTTTRDGRVAGSAPIKISRNEQLRKLPSSHPLARSVTVAPNIEAEDGNSEARSRHESSSDSSAENAAVGRSTAVNAFPRPLQAIRQMPPSKYVDGTNIPIDRLQVPYDRTAESRRRPAHRSVSLKHELPNAHLQRHPTNRMRKPEEEQLSSSPEEVASSKRHIHRPQSTASSLINHKASSGESSNADTWFDRSNQNVPKSNDEPPGEISPPFFVQHSSTDTSGNAGAPRSLPFRSIVPKLSPMGSSSEEYRSVIDDLTIKNKKLKKKLKGFERYKQRNLESETMFEVKVRGLSREKKRELERLLADFALGSGVDRQKQPQIENVVSQRPGSSTNPSKPTSSLTSTRAADSGYGSMSISHQEGSSHRNSDSTIRSDAAVKSAKPASSETSRARDKVVQSFLHDIPEGLLPGPPRVMTEKAKKKLVVRILEQFLGGRGASADGPEQSMQQQRVSHSATEEDNRRKAEATGQPTAAEGKREAYIMEQETEEPMDLSRDNASPDNTNAPKTDDKRPASDPMIVDPQPPTFEEPPDQRPTRPLDLDPNRAQIPAENLEYIRHLGFMVPDLKPGGKFADEQGWIYFNLMFNLAQLHTHNVTVDFVRQAIRDYSQLYELSSDNRKIRWKGYSSQPPQLSSHSSSASQSQHSSVDDSKQAASGDKRSRSSNFLESTGAGTSSKKRLLNDKFHYQSIFKRRQTEDDDDDDLSMSDDDSDSSPLPGDLTGESSALATSSRFTGSGSRRQDDGPLVFYKDQQFFSDLSGDRVKPNSPVHVSDARSGTGTPLLGVGRRATAATKPSRAGSVVAKYAHRYFSHNTREPPYSSHASPMGPPDKSDITMDVDSFSPRHVSFTEAKDVVDFQASGIGGIIPSDNVTIFVVRGIGAASNAEAMAIPHIMNKLEHLFPERKGSSGATEKILSVRKVDLDPSEVPPPMYIIGSDDEDDDHDESYDSDSTDEDAIGAPALANQPIDPNLNGSARSSEQESGEDDDDESEVSDDSSLDFLATARAIDPEAIYAREREYDAAMAERLAEEIPAGSSAATAGGGSGFNSPVGLRHGMTIQHNDILMEEGGENDEEDRRKGRAGSVSS